MDNLTHSLFGAVLARTGLAKAGGPGATALLVVASNIPDLDAILVFTRGDEAAWLRRTHTHCIVGAPLLALGLALAWWLATRGRMRFLPALGLALLGAAGHVALDLLNSYGVVALWPFSHARLELSWVFIIDLAMWAILLAPFLAERLLRGRVGGTTIHRVATLLLALYLGLCAAGHARAGVLLRQALARDGVNASFTYVFPEALGCHRWRGVARDGDTWRVYLVRVLEGSTELVRTERTAADDPRVAQARATERGRTIEWFFKAPVWSVAEDGTHASCFDLRFVSAVLDRGRGPFTYDVPLAPR